MCGRPLQPPAGGDAEASIEAKISLPSPGDRLGRFELDRVIGQGGAGTVFLAQDTFLKSQLAVKVLDPSLRTDEGFERFRREVLLARRVLHPGVCQIYDMHEDGPHVFIAMEYVEGVTLHALLQLRRSLPPAEAIDIVAQVCSAVQSAHALDIIHRDIKPANIMVRGNGRVSILDFGLSKATTMARITAAGVTVGTLSYLAPEVLRGEAATKQSDAYSTGVVLYECLTGCLPYDAESVIDFVQAIMEGRVVHPLERRPSLDPELAAAASIALRYDRQDRFSSMARFEETIQRLAGGPPPRRPQDVETAEDGLPASTALGLEDPTEEIPRAKIEAHDVVPAHALTALITRLQDEAPTLVQARTSLLEGHTPTANTSVFQGLEELEVNTDRLPIPTARWETEVPDTEVSVFQPLPSAAADTPQASAEEPVDRIEVDTDPVRPASAGLTGQGFNRTPSTQSQEISDQRVDQADTVIGPSAPRSPTAPAVSPEGRRSSKRGEAAVRDGAVSSKRRTPDVSPPTSEVKWWVVAIGALLIAGAIAAVRWGILRV